MIYENIARLCKSKGISITALELEMNFGNGTIHSWKTSSPSINKLKAVADFFGCTVDELLTEHEKTA